MVTERHEVFGKLKMRLHSFQSSNEMIEAAVKCTHIRRLAHLPSASEESTGVTETTGGEGGVEGRRTRDALEFKTISPFLINSR